MRWKLRMEVSSVVYGIAPGGLEGSEWQASGWNPNSSAPVEIRRSSYVLSALIDKAGEQGLHVLIGGIDSENGLSIALHKAYGFEETGRLPQVGRKFDRWLTLVFLQKQL